MSDRIELSFDKTLRALRIRWRALTFFNGSLFLLISVLSLVLSVFILDNVIHFPEKIRILVLILFSIFLIGLFIFSVHKFFLKNISLDEVAILIESQGEKNGIKSRNSLINAIQLSRENFPPQMGRLVALIVKEAENIAPSLPKKKIFNITHTVRLLKLFIIITISIFLYFTFLPDYAHNAIRRFSNPYSFVPPISHTQFTVTPGDASIPKGDSVEILLQFLKEPSKSADIEIANSLGDKRFSMKNNQTGFCFKLDNVTEDCSYKIYAGDARSKNYKIKVLDRPEIEKLSIVYNYPEYTNLPEKTIKDFSGNIDCYAETKTSLIVETNLPVKEATANLKFDDKKVNLPMKMASEKTFCGNFTINSDGEYSIYLKSKEGIENYPIPNYKITIQKDLSPEINIISPKEKEKIITSGENLSIVLEGKDDLGLSEISLLLEEEKCRNWEVENKKKFQNIGTVLEWKEISSLLEKPGSILHLTAEAVDTRQNKSRSNPLVLKFLSKEEKNNFENEQIKEIEECLIYLLNLQKQNKINTESLLKIQRFKRRNDGMVLLEDIVKKQEGIASKTDEFVQTFIKIGDSKGKEASKFLSNLLMSEISDAVSIANKILKIPILISSDEEIEKLLNIQTQIIVKIESFLNSLQTLLALKGDNKNADEKSETNPQSKLSENESEKQKFEKFKDNLNKFIEKQKEVIGETERIKKEQSEDFTEEEKKKMEEIKATELEWGRYFKDFAEDLSKLPNQDFSGSNLLNELVEIYSELSKSSEALKNKAIEIAVALEQMGLEKAEEIKMNIERWLSETSDYQKWVLEEPITEQEIPMVDLPEELEDIIGDLLDKEEEMTEEIEDVTSSWIDSLDEGAGWAVSDGPISNLSAKGITGNLMPNSNEIGGRSGEGRSGKSRGQMVEKTASGKGGRDTPTRLTNDPYEGGEVQDSSRDHSGGSTGGGKLSGSAPDGLRGAPPPEVKKNFARIANAQVEIRNVAEKINDTLKKRNFVCEDLEKAIENMGDIERNLRDFVSSDLIYKNKKTIQHLLSVKRILSAQNKITRDTSFYLPKSLENEINASVSEPFPEEYKNQLKNYFSKLSGIK